MNPYLKNIADNFLQNLNIYLKYFDINKADEILSKTYNSIIEKINQPDPYKVHLITPPEKHAQKDALLILAEASDKNSYQLTLWDTIGDGTAVNGSIEVLDDINMFQGEIVAFVGSIGVLKREDQYYLYDFKKLIGQAISIQPNDDLA